jgi:hypothetical protein
VSLVLVGRALDVDDFAAYAVLLSVSSVLGVLLDLGLAGLALTGSSHELAFKDFLGRGMRGLRGPLTIAILLCATVVMRRLSTTGASTAVGLCAFAVACQQVARNWLLGCGRSLLDARVTILEALGLSVATAAVATATGSVSLTLGAYGACLMAGAASRALLVGSAPDQQVAPTPQLGLRQGLPFALQLAAAVLFARGDLLLLAGRGAAALAITQYQFCSRLYYALPLPFESDASQLYGERVAPPAADLAYRRRCQAAAALSVVLLPGSVLAMRLAGVTAPSDPVFWALLTAACAFRLMTYFPGALLTVLGRQKERAAITITSLTLDLGGLALLLMWQEPSLVNAASMLLLAEAVAAIATARATGMSVAVTLRSAIAAFVVAATLAAVLSGLGIGAN